MQGNQPYREACPHLDLSGCALIIRRDILKGWTEQVLGCDNTCVELWFVVTEKWSACNMLAGELRNTVTGVPPTISEAVPGLCHIHQCLANSLILTWTGLSDGFVS